MVDLQYQDAVKEFVQKQMPSQQASSVTQSSVLVTAYAVHAHVETDGSNSQQHDEAPAAVVKALQFALSQHLQRHKNSEATVSVVLSNKVDSQPSNSTISSGRLMREGDEEEVEHLHLEAGVVIQGMNWANHGPLEEMLEQQDSISAVKNGMNEELSGSGIAVQELKPAVMTPGILLTVECATEEAVEKSTSTACGHDAATWVSWVHQAAAVKELQEPQEVWVLKNDQREETVILAADFGSLHVEETTWRPPVATLAIAAAATALVAIIAMAVYATYSRISKRKGEWDGYQSVRAGVAVPVGESVLSAWSPKVLRQPWQSSFCKRPRGARAWQEPAVSAPETPKESTALLPTSQPSWLGQNSQRTMRASSLQSFSIDPVRLEGLRTSTLEQAPSAQGALGTEIQCSPRTTTSDVGSIPPVTPEVVRMRSAASRYVPGTCFVTMQKVAV